MSLFSNMRGPRLKTPLLLLLLLSSLTGKAFSQDESEEAITESTEEPQETETPTPTLDENQGGGTTQTSPTSISSQAEAVLDEEDTGSASGHPAGVDRVNSTGPTQEGKDLDLLTILIPAILAVVLIAAIIFGAVVIKRQCNKSSTIQEESKEDPYLDESSTEKVPMPMFEEDVPSVLELEMDELDKWMQKDF